MHARAFVTILGFFAASGCGGPANAPSGGGGAFVGRIEAKTTSDGGKATSGSCLVSAGRLACESNLPTQGRVVIAFDDAQKKVCTNIAGSVSTQSYGEAAKDSAKIRGTGASGAHPAFTKTGKSYDVAGRHCEEWQAQSAITTFTACLDESLHIDVKGPPGNAVPMLGFDGLPPGLALTNEVTPRDGGPVITTTVTKLSERAVDDGEFATCPTR